MVWDTAVGHLCNNFGAVEGRYLCGRNAERVLYGLCVCTCMVVPHRRHESPSRRLCSEPAASLSYNSVIGWMVFVLWREVRSWITVFT